MKIRHIALIGSLLSMPAHAQLQVIDTAALLKWVQQAQQMEQTITQLEAQVRALTDIPQNLAAQTEGLINAAVSNPLGQIMQNLTTLLNGSGPGNCGNSQTYLTQNSLQPPQGSDFMSQITSQNINRQAGLLACTQQMMTATTTALGQIQALLPQLQGATDVTQATAINGRIMAQIATMQAQQQQAQLLASESMLQTQINENKILQKQRSDATAVMQGTAPGAAPGVIPTVQPFTAGGT